MNVGYLSPSRAARRMSCPGSHFLEIQYPREKTEPEKMGDAAHEVAMSALYTQELQFKEGQFAKNNELVTWEMIEGAKIWKNEILSHVPFDQLHIEEWLDISIINSNCAGRPDCWAFLNNTLYIWDYKFGHKYVSANENWQLIEYCAGILNYLNIEKENYKDIIAHFCIVQPRSFHRDGPVRKWAIKVDKLKNYFDKLIAIELEATTPNAICNTSSECNLCSARHACTTLQHAVQSTLDVSETAAAWDLNSTAAGHELHNIRRAIEILEARATGLEEQITAFLKKKQPVPHYVLSYGRGSTVWDVSIDQIIKLGSLYGLNLAKPVQPVTPKQATDLGLPEPIVKKYSKNIIGKEKLTEIDLDEISKHF